MSDSTKIMRSARGTLGMMQGRTSNRDTVRKVIFYSISLRFPVTPSMMSVIPARPSEPECSMRASNKFIEDFEPRIPQRRFEVWS